MNRNARRQALAQKRALEPLSDEDRRLAQMFTFPLATELPLVPAAKERISASLERAVDQRRGKTWGGNEVIAEDALKSGLFQLRGDLPVAHSGYVEAPAWQIVAGRAS